VGPFDPVAGIEEGSAHLFLSGSTIGALLIQRGVLVLHSGVVLSDDCCIVCLGHSVAGKSILATAVSLRGCKMLGDDLVAVTVMGG
jgi:hypothetical protein